MILNYNLFIILLILVFIAFVLYLKIRKRFPKQQICWFCHKSQKVSSNQINSFNCIHCQQYNGFSEDGNYNKVINEQFESRHVQYCQPISDSHLKCVQLCGECNLKQEIKIKLLAQFFPFNDINFNEECDQYKKYLEKEYKLCPNCETTVKNVLSKPINCIKDIIKNTIPSKVDLNIDTVFERESIIKNWFWFSVILEVFCLFCSLILFVFGLDEYQNKTELSIIEFPENLIQYLNSCVSDQKIVMFSGFMSSLTAIIISDKKSLGVTKLVSQLLWLGLIFSELSLMLTYIEKIDSILLRPILSLFVIFFSSVNSFLRLFSFFNSKSKIKQNLNLSKVQKKYLQNSMNNQKTVYLPENQLKSFNRNDIKTDDKTTIKSAEQSIGEQIKNLSILDETDLTLNYKSSHKYLEKPLKSENIFYNNRLNSSLISETSSGKSIILPAKFHYQSVAQTSWVSSFKPNTTPHKEKLNSWPYFTNSQSFSRTSQWVNHNFSGLVTPPPSAPTSATPSVCSDSALVNRFSSLEGNNCLFPQLFDSQRNPSSNSNNHLMRSRLISQHIYSRDSNKETNSEVSGVTPINGSLSSFNKTTSNECLKPEEVLRKESTFFTNLTQNLMFALFLLILFCFVIFLSLPVVFNTSCDLHSTECRFSVDNLPQINVCIK